MAATQRLIPGTFSKVPGGYARPINEQYHAWCAYNYEDEYRYTARKADA